MLLGLAGLTLWPVHAGLLNFGNFEATIPVPLGFTDSNGNPVESDAFFFSVVTFDGPVPTTAAEIQAAANVLATTQTGPVTSPIPGIVVTSFQIPVTQPVVGSQLYVVFGDGNEIASATFLALIDTSLSFSRTDASNPVPEALNYVFDDIADAEIGFSPPGGPTIWYQTAFSGDPVNPTGLVGDFEGDTSGWQVSNGLWEIGAPTSGPNSGFGGSANVAATVLDGNYVDDQTSRLASPSVTIPPAGFSPRLRWRHWYQFGSADAGSVEVSTDGVNWTRISGFATASSLGTWEYPSLDLSAYGGQTVQLGFVITTSNAGGGPPDVAPGWYIDDVEIETTPPADEPDIVVEEPAGNGIADGGIRDFGTLPLLSTSDPKTFTIRNEGEAPLTITEAQLFNNESGAYDLNTDALDLDPNLDPGESTTVTITFSPSTEGISTATLSLTSNDPDESPFVVNLTGEGRQPVVLSEQAYLKAFAAGTEDQFGFAVAVSGDTMIIGAPFEDSNATGINGDQSNNSSLDSGAAYIFQKDLAGMWVQTAYLKASNANGGDEFGFAVALSGDTAVVTAWKEDSDSDEVNGDEDDNSATDSGAAYVFTRFNNTWTQQAYLKATNTEARDQFGNTVAISGDTIIVGALQEDSEASGVDGDEDSNTLTDAGAAYVFHREGTDWSPQGYLKASNPGANDRFGFFVGVSGDYAIVSAVNEDSDATGIDGEQTNNSASNAGAAYIFIRNGENWSQEAYLKGSNTGAGDCLWLLGRDFRRHCGSGRPPGRQQRHRRGWRWIGQRQRQLGRRLRLPAH